MTRGACNFVRSPSAVRTARSACARHGSAYVLVLGAAMIVTMIGVGGAIASRAARKAAQLDSDGAALTHAAMGALRSAAGNAQNSVAWRSAAKAAAPLSLTVDGITISAVASDPDDADLSNDLTGRVRFLATATKGQARRLVAMTLEPDDTLTDALGSALHAGGNITMSGSKGSISAMAPVSANGSIAATKGTIRADVASVGTISGTITGTQTTLAAALAMPSGVSARYEALGTTIPLASFSGRKIDKNVLGAAKNPFGSTNAKGVYVVDCAGNDFQISDSRLECTLVLKNCKLLTLSGSVLWAPPKSGWPILVISGDVKVDTDAQNLSEPSAKVNFNPTGLPYQGVSDFDTVDTYPSMLQGIVYISGNLEVNNRFMTLEGVAIVTGDVDVSGSGAIRIRYKCDNAPPGFAKREYTADLSSLARVVE